MGDNTIQTGADTIATDELTTLNGGAVSGVKVQRMKVGFGSDAALRDVDAANPLPVVNASLPLPVGAATAANQQTNALTDTQLRAVAVPVSGTFFQATQPVSGTVTANAGTNLNTSSLNLEATQSALSAKLPATLGQKAMAASLAVTLASDQTTLPAVAETRASTLWITATAAVNTAATASLPAAGAGLFHYITRVELIKLYAVVGVAAGTGVIITTTNLPGNPAFTTEQSAGVAGMAPVVINWTPATPFKSSVANTITTFVAPVQLQTIWRWNISYFTAA